MGYLNIHSAVFLRAEKVSSIDVKSSFGTRLGAKDTSVSATGLTTADYSRDMYLNMQHTAYKIGFCH